MVTACVTGGAAGGARLRASMRVGTAAVLRIWRGRYVIAPDHHASCDLLIDDPGVPGSTVVIAAQSEALTCFSDAMGWRLPLCGQAGRRSEIVRRAKGDERIGGEAGPDDDAPAWDATSRRAALRSAPDPWRCADGEPGAARAVPTSRAQPPYLPVIESRRFGSLEAGVPAHGLAARAGGQLRAALCSPEASEAVVIPELEDGEPGCEWRAAWLIPAARRGGVILWRLMDEVVQNPDEVQALPRPSSVCSLAGRLKLCLSGPTRRPAAQSEAHPTRAVAAGRPRNDGLGAAPLWAQ